jgi:hypothetical protein
MTSPSEPVRSSTHGGSTCGRIIAPDKQFHRARTQGSPVVATAGNSTASGRGSLKVHPVCRGTSQVYLHADQRVCGLVKSVRAWLRASTRRTACGFWAPRRRGDVGHVGRGTARQDGWLGRMTSSLAFPTGTGVRNPAR